MIQGAGKLLTAEQSVRLALMDTVDRDQLIAAIVARLRKAVLAGNGKGTPREWYRADVAGRRRGNRI